MRAPVVLFTYYNPILRRGTEKFIAQIAEAGASGPPPPGRRPAVLALQPAASSEPAALVGEQLAERVSPCKCVQSLRSA